MGWYGKEGVSSYQVMAALEDEFAKTMPGEMGFDYKDMSFQEQQAQKGVSPTIIFGLSLLFVFLILAAQYESWVRSLITTIISRNSLASNSG